MLLLHTSLVIVILCLNSSRCFSQQLYCAKLNSITRWNDIEYINFNMIGKSENAIIKYNLTLDLHRDFLKCFVRIEGYWEHRGRNQLLINKTINLCALLHGKEVDIVALTILSPLRNYRTLPAKCPVRQGHYYAYNVQFDDGSFPLLMPQGTFTVKLFIFAVYADELKLVSSLKIVGSGIRKRRRIPC